MSKLAKKPIIIPQGVEVKLTDERLEVKNKEILLSLKLLNYILVNVENNQIVLKTQQTHKQARANLGTMAALIKNALEGASKGFMKVLEIEGIGYRVSLEGNNLVLNVGFTHPVKFTPPAGIKLSVEKNVIKISGADKNLVGQAAADIRKLKKPEPYKGKGIHYQGEIIRRKAGKKVAGAGAAAAG